MSSHHKEDREGKISSIKPKKRKGLQRVRHERGGGYQARLDFWVYGKETENTYTPEEEIKTKGKASGLNRGLQARKGPLR